MWGYVLLVIIAIVLICVFICFYIDWQTDKEIEKKHKERDAVEKSTHRIFENVMHPTWYWPIVSQRTWYCCWMYSISFNEWAAFC